MLTAFLVGDQEVIERLKAVAPAAKAGLKSAILKLALDLQRHVQQDKLSGQVLNRRTGNLRSSINVKGPEENAGVIEASVGTNVVYAAIHEFGGTVNMPARTVTIYRRFSDGVLSNRFVKKSQSNFATDHAVGAYEIHMPERSFLRSALADYRDRIKTGIAAAVKNSVEGGTTP